MLIELLKVLAHCNIELKVKRDNNGDFEIHLKGKIFVAFIIPTEDLFMKTDKEIWDEYFQPAFIAVKNKGENGET